MEGILLCLMVIRVHPRRIWHTRDEQVKGNEQTWLAVSTCLLNWRKMSFTKTTQKGNRWLTCSLANCRRKNVSCPRCCWSPHSAERVLSSDCYHNKHCVHICLYSSSTLPTSSHMTSGIWNPSKSEVMGRCGGDEKNEWPRRTDKSRTLIFFKNPLHLLSYLNSWERASISLFNVQC